MTHSRPGSMEAFQKIGIGIGIGIAELPGPGPSS